MRKLFVTICAISMLALALSSCKSTPVLNFKIYGLNKELSSKVTSRLQAKQKTITIYNQQNITNFYDEIPYEISQQLKLEGYFNAKIKPFGDLAYKNKQWNKNFTVNLKKPIIITAIDLQISGTGKDDKNFTHYLKRFPLKKGDLFQTEEYNSAKQFLFDTADSLGYAKASLVNKEVKINLQNNTAEIILHFDTGPRYYFGKTDFTVPKLSKSFLKKFLPYKEGDVYTNTRLYTLQENLNNSNLFKNIVVAPRLAKEENQNVPIEVRLALHKSKRYSVGAGFGTDTGPRASLGMQILYLTPYAHSFKAWSQFSQVQQMLELDYLIPGKNPLTDLYNFNATARALDFAKGKSTVGTIGVAYTTNIKNWQRSLKINFQNEKYKLENQRYYQYSTLLIPSFNLSYIKTDDLLNPINGYSINANVRGAIKHVLADDNFMQMQLDAKYMKQIIPRTQIVLRGSLGYTAIDELSNLPLSLQFYTGGSQSIRGFGYNTIGPGYNLIVGSTEIRFTVYKNWYIATFYDAGNVNDDLFKKIKQSAGIGIGLRTSVGNLELTYAKAISEKGTPGRIEFNLGGF